MTAELDRWFAGRPASREIFDVVAGRIDALGPSEVSVGSQISFGLKRKFAWFWLYNVTKSDPDGVPHLMLALHRAVDIDQVRNVSQIGKHRWNHQIVLRTVADARSDWLGDLLAEAHDYGAGGAG
jgi:hypothetical protein